MYMYVQGKKQALSVSKAVHTPAFVSSLEVV